MRLPQFDDDGLEIERFARMSPEQRLALFLELCDLTDSIQRGRPDVHHLRRGAPISAEAEALWQRLMHRARHG